MKMHSIFVPYNSKCQYFVFFCLCCSQQQQPTVEFESVYASVASQHAESTPAAAAAAAETPAAHESASQRPTQHGEFGGPQSADATQHTSAVRQQSAESRIAFCVLLESQFELGATAAV